MILLAESYATLALNAFGEKHKIIIVDTVAINAQLNQIRAIGRSQNYPLILLPTVYPMVAECINSGVLKYSEFLRVIVGNKEIKGRHTQIEPREITYSLADEILSKAALPIGKTVILSADNNSQVELPVNFWIRIVEVIRELGLTPCLNTSGTLNGKPANILAEYDQIAKIKIPPHLAVSIPERAGFYIGGTNGFQTIQSCFNLHGKGIHLINGIEMDKGFIRDKSNNLIPVAGFYHKNVFFSEFLHNQTELLLKSSSMDEDFEKEIKNVLVY